jgi:SAM-dependent methyltransferase
MSDSQIINLPPNLDWQQWIDRWDRMQERYLVRRDERFDIMVRLIRETQHPVNRVLDLGCGTGSTMLPVLEAFPEAQVVGIDLDPTILPLAEARLARFSDRAHLIRADLRKPGWYEDIPMPMDAVVSATALHWMDEDQLANLYDQIAQIIRPGGIFLNADHVSSESAAIQQAWERHREEMRHAEGHVDADDWNGFWDAYAQALDVDIASVQEELFGELKEIALPLAWHIDHLRSSGFVGADCFWRCDCDAIYGGIRS